MDVRVPAEACQAVLTRLDCICISKDWKECQSLQPKVGPFNCLNAIIAVQEGEAIQEFSNGQHDDYCDETAIEVILVLFEGHEG